MGLCGWASILGNGYLGKVHGFWDRQHGSSYLEVGIHVTIHVFNEIELSENSRIILYLQ